MDTAPSTSTATNTPRTTPRPRGNPGLQRLLSIAELSEYLGIPVATIYDCRVDGKGPRALRVDRAWLDDNEVRDIAVNTGELYERDMRTIVLPAFENYTLREVTVSRVDRFLKAQARISYSRAAHAHFGSAETDHVISPQRCRSRQSWHLVGDSPYRQHGFQGLCVPTQTEVLTHRHL